MDTELVIKAKYRDTLRRFSVLFNRNGSLDLDMDGLRAKICNLFKFAPDTDFTLTYIDEDNDMVTLVEDADLRDAIKQHLDPLRITVSLNSDSAGKHPGSGSSTPLSSPHTTTSMPPLFSKPMPQPPFPLVKPSHFPPMAPPSFDPIGPQISDDLAKHASSSTEAVLRPEQLISKIVHDLTSKVASSAPEQYRDFISKFSHDVMSKAATASSAPLVELMETLSKLGISHQEQVSKDQVVTVSKKPSNNIEKADSDSLKSLKDPVLISEVLSNANNDNPAYNAEGHNDPKNSGVPTGSGFSPLVCSNSGKMPHKEGDGYPHGACPFWGDFPPLANSESLSGQRGLGAPIPVSFDGISRRNYVNSDNMGRVFHQGVICDGCGVHPITGPRYLSNVKENYDLCYICYAEMGNEAEYTKIDRPVCYRSPRLPKFHHRRVQRPLLPLHGLRSRVLRSSHQPKLDSCFIEDVNIVDGTLMAPSTHFTKIWRMHNNGAVAWTRGTQLVWIGGDQLTHIKSSVVELPVEGCPVGLDLNVAIEFTAPEVPGQYVSYWRMALPSGQKFGQCVWVLIQVDTPQRDSRSESCRSLNLNLPPDSSDSKDQITDMNVEPMDASHTQLQSNVAAELEEPMADVLVYCNDNALPPEIPAAVSYPTVDFSVPSELPAEVPATLSYPTVDLSVPSELPAEGTATLSYPTVEFSVPSELTPVADVHTFSSEVSDGDTLEQSLLEELDQMGFKEIDLNKKVLKENEYDLGGAVDELCGLAEWDPMLEELQEMGFHDKETNRKLLIKNGGSIKRVVMDLIAAEKA